MVALRDAASAAVLEHRMHGDEPAILQDVDSGGGDLDLELLDAHRVLMLSL
jgi:hypothetical protein